MTGSPGSGNDTTDVVASHLFDYVGNLYDDNPVAWYLPFYWQNEVSGTYWGLVKDGNPLTLQPDLAVLNASNPTLSVDEVADELEGP